MIHKVINRFQKAAFLRWPFIVFFIALFVSCESTSAADENGVVVAEYDKAKLYEDDLKSAFGPQWKDQTGPVKNYIRLWAKNQVVGSEAQNKLTEREKDFTKQLNDYKNSLLRYAFERMLVDSLLETEVSDSAIQEYYNENQKNFELKENIVRVRYVKVPKKSNQLNKLKYLIQYKDSVGQSKFFKIVKQEGFFCEVNDSDWVELEELKNLVPIKLYNDQHFLRNYKYTEAPDGDFVWIVYFTANRLKNGTAPVKMVEELIKASILNKRKQQIITKKEEELFNSAKQNNQLKIYVEF